MVLGNQELRNQLSKLDNEIIYVREYMARKLRYIAFDKLSHAQSLLTTYFHNIEYLEYFDKNTAKILVKEKSPKNVYISFDCKIKLESGELEDYKLEFEISSQAAYREK